MRIRALLPSCLVFGLLGGASATLQAQEPPPPPAPSPTPPTTTTPLKVAIMGLTAPGFNKATVENLYGILVAEIDSLPQYKVIARDEIEALLGLEQQKSLLGCDDTSCLAEIAGALGVDKVIAGKVGKVGSTFVVNLTLIDHKTAAVENRVVRTVKGEEDELIEAIATIGRELVGAEGGSTAVSDATSASAAADASAVADASAATEPVVATDKGGGMPMLPVVMLAAGGLGAVAGGALLGFSVVRYSDYQAATEPADAKTLQEEIPIWWISGGVITGIGAAALAAGAVLFAVGE